MTTHVHLAIVGCGDIARKAYLPFFQEHAKDVLRIIGCTDVRTDMAERLAEDFDIQTVYPDVETLLADPDVDVVLNLTHPAAHAPVNLQALKAGKHAYCEKPFALNMKEAEEILEEATRQGLKVGCAPDTVLGSGTQATRRLIESGAIGTPLYGKLHMGGAGHEHWHPNPEFYYKQGGGPMLDMGPYYLSALIQLLGPIKSVEGRAVTGFQTRTISSDPLAGTEVKVETPTHYVGSVETVSGAIIQMLFSFDLKFGADGINLPEIYGTEGTLRGTNPNAFGGTPMLNQNYPGGELNEQDAPETYPQGRGLGLLDLIASIEEHREPRAGGQLAVHALEVMLAFHQSEAEGRRIDMKTTCEHPSPMPLNGL